MQEVTVNDSPANFKREHQFVAETYRYLAPFIDSSKGVYLSLDGEAAKQGVLQGIFQDACVPDLWFTFVGANQPLLIEAKILSGNQIKLQKDQLLRWRTNGTGAHKPHAWIAADQTFKNFYFWEHTLLCTKLDASNATTDQIAITPPRVDAFDDIRKLALHIIRTATIQ
jgi:hypothetical protein